MEFLLFGRISVQEIWPSFVVVIIVKRQYDPKKSALDYNYYEGWYGGGAIRLKSLNCSCERKHRTI